jgi:hypothetical protein
MPGGKAGLLVDAAFLAVFFFAAMIAKHLSAAPHGDNTIFLLRQAVNPRGLIPTEGRQDTMQLGIG